VDEGKIVFFNFPEFELFGKRLMSVLILGYHQDPGSLLVEAVDDSGSEKVSGEEIPKVVQECVRQRPGPVSCSRMDDDTCLFVYDNEIIVLIENLDGDRFRSEFRNHRRNWNQFDRLRSTELVACLAGNTVDGDMTRLNPSLNGCATRLFEVMGQEGVQSGSLFFRRDRDHERMGLFNSYGLLSSGDHSVNRSSKEYRRGRSED
jgi:hypothetical protein